MEGNLGAKSYKLICYSDYACWTPESETVLLKALDLHTATVMQGDEDKNANQCPTSFQGILLSPPPPQIGEKTNPNSKLTRNVCLSM